MQQQTQIRIVIPRTKAEIPVFIVGLFVIFGITSFSFTFLDRIAGLTFGIVLLIGFLAFILFKIKQISRTGYYFVEADLNGIRWRQNILSSYKNIPWKYLQRIDYLEFEINFMLKETAQVISFATSGLGENSSTELKQTISNIMEELGLSN